MTMVNYGVSFEKNDKDFAIEIKQAIDQYFSTKKNGTKANGKMWVKIFFWLIMWAFSYLSLFIFNLKGPALFVLGIFHILTHLFVAFNISHDANHFSISDNKKVNHILSYTLDLIGASSHLWRIAHNLEHHSFINVEGVDPSVEGYGVMKLTPETEHKKQYKYQYLYVFFIYSLSTLNFVLTKDFKLINDFKKRGHTFKTSKVLEIIFFKLVYYSYMFVIPILLLDVSFFQVLFVFIIGHVIIGLTLALVFQCGHLTNEAEYPHVHDGKISSSWIKHVIQTTGDFGKNQKLLTWLCGGINIHAIHHIYPHICHIHYKEVSAILKEIVESHNLKYREIPTFGMAIRSHIKLLKKLGAKPVLITDNKA